MASHGILSVSVEHSEMILHKMCEVIGIKYTDVDFSKPDWFITHSWTEEQEKAFQVWLGKFLKQHKYVGSGTKRGVDWGYYEAGKIIANYGWRTKYANT